MIPPNPAKNMALFVFAGTLPAVVWAGIVPKGAAEWTLGREYGRNRA